MYYVNMIETKFEEPMACEIKPYVITSVVLLFLFVPFTLIQG